MTRVELEQQRKQKIGVMKRNVLKAVISKYLKFLGFLAWLTCLSVI